MKRRNGFTLIELLTVLGIIGLLVTILLPSFGKVLMFTGRTRCMGNLKQLTDAVLAYRDDNLEILPPHQMEGGVASPSRWWGYDGLGRASATDGIPAEGDIWAYANMKQEVFRCPEMAQRGWEFNSDYVGYGYNAWFLGWNNGTAAEVLPEAGITPDLWCSFGYIRNASELIVFADSDYRPGLGARAGSYAMWYPTLGAHVDARHGDMGCVGFLDGRARPFAAEDINPATTPTAEAHPFILYWDPRQGR